MTPNRRDARVLVVDDDEDVRDMIAAVLGGDGYDVVTATGGQAAIDAVRASRFDAAVLDLRMPGMHGRQTLAALRAIAPGLAMIIASGYVTDEEREACRALGAREVISKPFSVRDLLSAVGRALEERGRLARRAEPPPSQ